jgi:hypothetical protein
MKLILLLRSSSDIGNATGIKDANVSDGLYFVQTY